MISSFGNNITCVIFLKEVLWWFTRMDTLKSGVLVVVQCTMPMKKYQIRHVPHCFVMLLCRGVTSAIFGKMILSPAVVTFHAISWESLVALC